MTENFPERHKIASDADGSGEPEPNGLGRTSVHGAFHASWWFKRKRHPHFAFTSSCFHPFPTAARSVLPNNASVRRRVRAVVLGERHFGESLSGNLPHLALKKDVEETKRNSISWQILPGYRQDTASTSAFGHLATEETFSPSRFLFWKLFQARRKLESGT